MSEYDSLGVKTGVKREFERLRSFDQTQTEFLNELLECYKDE
jgi:hypothetical protein